MFFRSLKKEILIFTLGLTIITIVAITAIGVSSTQTAGKDAAGATSGILRKQAQDFLTQIALSAALQQDLSFERVRNDTGIVASYVSNIYDNPSIFSHGSYWDFDARITHSGGRYLNSASDVSTVDIPNFVVLNNAEKNNINLSANLDFIVPRLLTNNPDAVAIYAIDTQGVTRYFPNIVLGSIAPPDYDPREDIYYKPATPSEDPDKDVVWSLPYDDVAGRGLMITATAPVYTKKGFAGGAATDVLLTNIIKAITAYSPIEGSYAFLIDKNGNAIAFPEKAYQDILGRSRNVGEVRTTLATSSPEFITILKQMTSGTDGFGSIHSGGKELFIAYAPLKQTGFSLGVVAQETVMLKAVETLNTEISSSVQKNIWVRVLPASLLSLFIASILSILLVTRIIKPIRQLTKGIEEIGRGNLDYNITVNSKNEIGNLARSFNQMSQALSKSRKELKEYSRGLEEKVGQRTQELTDANKRQENLLHFISHEIKGYLTDSQAGFASIAEGDFGAVTLELKTMAQNALVKIRQGIDTIVSILKASDMKKGTVAYKKAPLDFRVVVQSIVSEQKSAAYQKHLGLDVDIAEGKYLMQGDEEKLREHVVRNLIDNGVKYTPSGTIRVELSHRNGMIRFMVQDSGVGITPEDMTRLFTEGGHGKDSILVNVHSTGYGLFIAKQVVDAHGGKIWAESEGEGKGARFIVELPIA